MVCPRGEIELSVQEPHGLRRNRLAYSYMCQRCAFRYDERCKYLRSRFTAVSARVLCPSRLDQSYIFRDEKMHS